MRATSRAGLTVAVAAQGQPAPTCDRPQASGAVAIFILADSSRVQSYAATVKDAPVVARDADTLVFRDGRVITSDVEGATRT